MSSTRRLVRLNTALIAALSLGACSGTIAGPSTAPSGPIASLAIDTNTVWHLRSITSADGSVLTIEDASLFTVTLTDDGKVNARADCNRASGGYRISGNVLSIGPIASTKAYCATAPVDQQLLMLLGGENIITTSDAAALQLSSRRGPSSLGGRDRQAVIFVGPFTRNSRCRWPADTRCPAFLLLPARPTAEDTLDGDYGRRLNAVT